MSAKPKKGVSLEILKEACLIINNTNSSVRSVAKSQNIPHVTLWRFLKDNKNGYKPSNKVFNEEQEKKLSGYLVIASFSNFGFCTKGARKLAYECAIKYNINCPEVWKKNQMAGKKWLERYMKRNPQLSLRSPVPTSLARLKNFNSENVSSFFSKLSQLYEKHNFGPESIYNIDETGLSTVQDPKKVITQRGVKRIGSATSGERGPSMTMMLGISASGTTIPPHYIFPRKIMKEFFLRDAPVNSIGTANGSGWMQENDFNIYIRHFSKYANASLQNPILLIMDNHSSHLSLDAIDFCRENGITCLTLPPHCTHKLQPLDKTIFGPFGKYFSSAQDDWMKNNPGKTLTIYDLPGLSKLALLKSISLGNVASGFSCTGIFPFNKDIFEKELEFQEEVSKNIYPLEKSNIPNANENNESFSPFEAFPLPKISITQDGTAKRGRKPLKCQILTDSPVRNKIAKNKEERETKAKNKEDRETKAKNKTVKIKAVNKAKKENRKSKSKNKPGKTKAVNKENRESQTKNKPEKSKAINKARKKLF